MSDSNTAAAAAAPSDFIREIVAADVAEGKNGGRVVTRFPPEPNGYLHIGHAKAICLDFGVASEFGGYCNLRFDDTNPVKEDVEYVDSIKADVEWLGFHWHDREYYASDYYEQLYLFAEDLIRQGAAYVDSLSADEIRSHRGTLTEPGTDSPHRNRGIDENLDLFRRMRGGEFPDGAHVLRARIDMASPNMNLRDPAIYRIRKVSHHRTGDKWSVYPMYTYAHPIEDALENITHSLCTLEFEDQRPFYDWLLGHLSNDGLLQKPPPQQIEFARLNLTYVMLSKRKLIELVEQKHVDGWDDPRMPTLAGTRRRGYTPEGFRLCAERVGVSKANQMIEYTILEDCMREHLNEVAPRRMAVLDPVKLVIENYPEGREEFCDVPNHPQKPDWGKRQVPFSRELWIEREDFTETPPKGYFRLFPGNKVRLRYGFVIECTGYDKTTDTVRCTYDPDTKSGTPGAEKVKVKGNIHWVSAKHARAAEVRMYDRLFKAPHPAGFEDLNPDSRKIITAQLEPALKDAGAEDRFQFERHGYFVADSKDSAPGAPKFNRAVTLRDSWQK